MIITGGKIYKKCLDCGKLVRINKPFLNDLHVCLTDQEIKQKRAAVRRYQQQQ